MRFLKTIAVLLLIGLSSGSAQAYPGGTPAYVANVAPYCAGCHSSISAAQLAGVPDARVRNEIAANKHLSKIESAKQETPYAKLSDAERQALIDGIKRIDAAASVKVVAPATVKAGSVIEVTIEATGGGGPVVGLALVDSDQRWQASPASARGWQVLDTPRVTGPDGKVQTRFTDNRNPKLASGISYVNVYGINADTAQNRYDSVSATFRLRVPAMPGKHPLAAVFLYGTEKGAPHGGVERPGRGVQPIGGFTGSSGRVRFSEVLQINVE